MSDFSRKSVSGNWKANIGSALLEQIPVNEKFKQWIDDISETFGGLEMCSIEAVITKENKEQIIEVGLVEINLFWLFWFVFSLGLWIYLNFTWRITRRGPKNYSRLDYSTNESYL